MRKSILLSTAFVLLCAAGTSQARDPIDNGNLVVKPVGTSQYDVGEFKFGKAEFFGYVGDLKDDNKITGILLKRGDKASAEQKHIVAEIAATQKISAFIELDGKVVPLVDETPVAPTAPPAVETH